jgi:molybdenum cofactor guanylyltransferase
MGRTKALIAVGGVPMAARVASSMADAGCSPVIALGGDPEELQSLGVEIVADLSPGEGPLVAVVAALSLFANGSPADGGRDVMVLACDLPFVSAADLGRLTSAAVAHPDADVIVARTDRLEPGCAIWRWTARHRLAERATSGERAVHRAMESLVTVEVPVDAWALRNINTPADVAGYP